MKYAAEIRKNHYPPLSALTKQHLGAAKPTIAQEVASVQSLIEYHERNDWQGLSQEEYDTLYPELTAYLANLTEQPK